MVDVGDPVQEHIERRIRGYHNGSDFRAFSKGIARDMMKKFDMVADVWMGWSKEHQTDAVCLQVTVSDKIWTTYMNISGGHEQ